jgi:1,4-alpha-glucan branching enzyme
MPDDFAWSDEAFRVPDVNDLVVYELMVDEFQQTFAGVVARLDYLQGLGVNAIEFMPLTNIAEPFRWGYMPLSYVAPEDRYGGPGGLKRLVNACHERGIAVIVDAVYSHAHPDFPFDRVYEMAGVANPMMGRFAEDMFGLGTDFGKAFTREFFGLVNRYWLDEFHVDGFRYDYVPGIYDGPVGSGYARIVYETYQYSKGINRFDDTRGHSRIIQCAEHLPDPKGILRETYSNAAWQNALLDKAEDMATHHYVDDAWAHLLDLSFLGYPEDYVNTGEGDAFPVTAFQYIESHDHSRLITRFGITGVRDAYGEAYGDRDGYWFKLQPFAIALYTAQGVPMLWQGQEFAENYAIPGGGFTRVLARRPLRWEHFYDRAGKGLVRLYRILGGLRRDHPALRSRRSWYYHLESRPRDGLIAYRRETGRSEEAVLVFLNFSDADQTLHLAFPSAGRWEEQIDGVEVLDVASEDDPVPVRVPSNYGRVFVRA